MWMYMIQLLLAGVDPGFEIRGSSNWLESLKSRGVLYKYMYISNTIMIIIVYIYIYLRYIISNTILLLQYCIS